MIALISAQAQAAALMMKNRQLVLPADVNSIFTLVDDGGYNAEEGNQLLKTLEGVDAYSRNGGVKAMEVAGSVLSSILRPYWKAPVANKANLFKMINTGLLKRFKFDARRFDRQKETDDKATNKQNLQPVKLNRTENDAIKYVDGVTKRVKSDEEDMLSKHSFKEHKPLYRNEEDGKSERKYIDYKKYKRNTKRNRYSKHDKLKRNKFIHKHYSRNKNNSQENFVTRKEERNRSGRRANKVKYNIHKTVNGMKEIQTFNTKSTTDQTDQANFENEDDSYDREIRNIKIEPVENDQERKIETNNTLTEKPEYSVQISGRRKGDNETDISINTVKKEIDISTVKNIAHKLIEDSSINDKDNKLKLMLVDVIKNNYIVFKKYRRTGDIVRVREKIDEVSSISDDEESLLKKNIYKALGCGADLKIN